MSYRYPYTDKVVILKKQVEIYNYYKYQSIFIIKSVFSNSNSLASISGVVF